MAKDAFYFSHDLGARNDPKLQKVLQKLGHEGKSIFWDLIEILHEEGGYLLLSDIENYAFSLRTTIDLIQSLIHDFGLFEWDSTKFWSMSALIRINEKDEKSIKAKDAAEKSWASRRNTNADASALQMQNNGNAIKERKGKEIKVKEIYKGLGFFNNGFLKVWNDYLEMRVKIRKPATERAEELALHKLKELSGGVKEIAVKVVEQSIANSWQGLFPLKSDDVINKKSIMGYPNYYSKKYEETLQQKDVGGYWAHLRSLGFIPKKDSQQNIIDWVKGNG